MPTESVRYLERKANGSFFYNAPKAARVAGLLQSQSLGFDAGAAEAQAAAFNEIYDAWRQTPPSARRIVRATSWLGSSDQTEPNPYIPKTLNHVAWRYLRSDHFDFLAASTQKSYRSSLNTLLRAGNAEHGTLGQIPVAAINRGTAQEIYRQRRTTYRAGAPIRLEAANAEMRVAALLWAFASNFNEVSGSNPFHKMRKRTNTPRSTTWDHEQVLRFAETAFENEYYGIGLAVLIAYEHAQRIGDVIKLTTQNYDGAYLTFQQSKTKVRIKHPVSEHLKQHIDRVIKKQKSSYLILGHRFHRPYKNVTALRSAFFRVLELAGYPKDSKIRLSDLRRSGALLYGIAGATDDELRAITGHLSREVVKRYIPLNSTFAENATQKREQYIRKMRIITT